MRKTFSRRAFLKDAIVGTLATGLDLTHVAAGQAMLRQPANPTQTENQRPGT